MEKWLGFGCRKIWKKCPDGKHRLAAPALAARRQRSGRAAECCNAML